MCTRRICVLELSLATIVDSMCFVVSDLDNTVPPGGRRSGVSETSTSSCSCCRVPIPVPVPVAIASAVVVVVVAAVDNGRATDPKIFISSEAPFPPTRGKAKTGCVGIRAVFPKRDFELNRPEL